MRRAILGILIAAAATGAAVAGGELYGTIHTADGRHLTGPIRWDVNENFWDDRLDARKTEKIEAEEEGFKLSVFGLKLFRNDSERYNAFSIPFGHLRSIHREGSGARVTLKSGLEINIEASSSDLGHGMRGLVIDDADKGPTELSWSSVRSIDFRANPGEGRDGERLYGTATTSGSAFTGYIVWDRDESLAEDVLDGESDGEDHEIRFGEIRSIERISSRASRVTLKDGTQLELSGTNDVDDDNRGVVVQVPGLGLVDFEWSDAEKVVFSDAPASPGYDSFGSGGEIRGAVSTVSGETLRGRIVWDQDEVFTWETLDGRDGRLDYSIPFSLIASIRPVGSRGSEVTLADGTVLRLTDSTDTGSDNRGVIVRMADGTERRLEWDDVRSVTLN